MKNLLLLAIHLHHRRLHHHLAHLHHYRRQLPLNIGRYMDIVMKKEIAMMFRCKPHILTQWCCIESSPQLDCRGVVLLYQQVNQNTQ
jgi:hypothetical protein